MSSSVESQSARVSSELGARNHKNLNARIASRAQTIIKTLLLAALSSCCLTGSGPGLGAAAYRGHSSTSGRNVSTKPIWQRPGCYQVGHTRTISIPGCVKFNLSTNACRGYCMSFSIPAAEDIGPPGVSLAELNDDAISFHEPIEILNNANEFAASERAMKRRELQRRKRRVGGSGQLNSLLWTAENYPLSSATSAAASSSYQKSRHSSLAAMVSGANSPLAGAVGNMGEKRDVISVGQCCNMMETEDVTVNLRCGFNETRRLVFKSAKTCECFFCKQV